MAVNLKIYTSIDSQSIANNSSTVTVYVNAEWTGGSFNWNQTSGTATINGTKYSFTSPFNTGGTTSGSVTVFEKTLTVAHDTNGEKTLECSATYVTGVSSGTIYASSAVVLTPIPQRSTFSVSGDDDAFPLGTALQFAITRKSTSYTHTLAYKCGTASGTICSKSSATSVVWTPPLTLAQQNTTGTSVSVTLTLTTYNGSTEIGARTMVITCAIPDSVKPTVSISVTDGAGCYSTYGAYVQGKSTLTVKLATAGAQGSTIKSQGATFDGQSYTEASFTIDAIKGTGNIVMTATAKDSRGRTGTAIKTLTVLAYEPPKVSDLVVRRCNSDGTANSTGAYLVVEFDTAVSSLSSKNSAAYTLKYKKRTATAYTSKTLTAYAGKYTVSGGSTVFAADTSASYDITLTVKDGFTSVSKSAVGSSAKKLWSAMANGLGFAFFKVAERAGMLDMGGGIYMNSNKVEALGEPTKDTDAATKGYVDSGKFPFTESADYPGCYYREVDGETEWLNPPMVYGTEYRTSERDAGNPVYVKRSQATATFNALIRTLSFAVASASTKILSLDVFVVDSSGVSHLLPWWNSESGDVMQIVMYNTTGYRIYAVDYTGTATLDATMKYVKA